jgi:alcohol dehydrogenase
MQKAYINQGLSVLKDILGKNLKRVFIVCGRNSYESVKNIINPYFSNLHTTFFFNEGTGINDIENGSIALKKSNADIVIAIGGGANIDLAKLINAFALIPKEKHVDVIKGKVEITKKNSKLLVIPTTAGTGSEATSFSVVYLGLDKFSVVSPYLLPDYAIADFELVNQAPKYLRACTAFDAFSQAIESYWSVGATKESKKDARTSIELISNNILKNVQQADKISIESMVEAAFLSGRAINISKTTAPHALSYYLTAKFNIPHGHAVALMLGIIGDLNFKSNISSLVDSMNRICKFSQIEAKNFGDNWYDLMTKCGLDSRLSSFGIKESDLTVILEKVNLERLKNHPFLVDKHDLLVKLKTRL